ncbi:hypothetical protein H8E88_19345 [candidate division KSB1 bacterium]|nr:hypothetical protein [candidate division KSB1 bacterium]
MKIYGIISQDPLDKKMKVESTTVIKETPTRYMLKDAMESLNWSKTVSKHMACKTPKDAIAAFLSMETAKFNRRMKDALFHLKRIQKVRRLKK